MGWPLKRPLSISIVASCRVADFVTAVQKQESILFRVSRHGRVLCGLRFADQDLQTMVVSWRAFNITLQQLFCEALHPQIVPAEFFSLLCSPPSLYLL